jgi:hypothetical protein
MAVGVSSPPGIGHGEGMTGTARSPWWPIRPYVLDGRLAQTHKCALSATGTAFDRLVAILLQPMDVEVARIAQRVPVLARIFDPSAPPVVFFARDGLEVRDFDAESDPTAVVDGQRGWDGAVDAFIGGAMGRRGGPAAVPFHKCAPVAVWLYPAGPEHTWRGHHGVIARDSGAWQWAGA